MAYAVLMLSTVMASGKALFCKTIGAEHRTKRERMAMNFQSFLVAFVCALCFVLPQLSSLLTVSAFSLLLSIAFGLSVAVTQFTQAKAMGSGPSAPVTLIYTCGFTVPLVCGALFWDETLSAFQGIGLLLLIASLFLIIEKRPTKQVGFGWLAFAVIAMLGSGLNAILQKTHQRSDFAAELPLFLVLSLFFSTVFTGIAVLLTPKEAKTDNAKKGRFTALLPSLGLGVCVGSLNFLNLYLAGKLPSVILFPTYNVGSMILTTALSAWFYRERLSKKQTVGLLIGTVAIVIIGLL